MSTAAIIAGGEAHRLGGQSKGNLPLGNTSFIDRQIEILYKVADDVLIVANDQTYKFLGVPVVSDLIPGAGAMGGIYTALTVAKTKQVLAVACDMPFLQVDFLKHVLVAGQTVDVAIPKTKHGYEPLCASYGQGCLPKMMQQITRGRFKLHDLLPYLKIREIGPGEIAAHDKDGNLFFNVNTPDDYRWALEQFKDG